MKIPSQKWLVMNGEGRILRYGLAPDEAAAFQQANAPGETVMLLPEDAEVSDETHYVQDGELIERPQLVFDKTEILADGADAATLASLPDPCTVLVDGDPHEITGGRIEMVTTMPGVYVIEIEDPFPYQPFRAEVTANAP